MENNILLFCAFATVAVLLTYIVPQRGRLSFLALLNVVFYLLCSWEMFGVLLGVILITFYGTRAMAHVQGRVRGRLLLITIVPSLLLLFLTKYLGILDLFVTRIVALAGFNPSHNALMAISILGLSYYVFRAVSYTIDVYKHKIDVSDNNPNLLTLFVYISFFPHIICGPISRYEIYRDSLSDIGYHEEKAVAGIRKIVLGIFMKAVISDRLSPFVANVYDAYDSVPGLALWMAAVFYSIQLYCDFAGYSYVAIGFTEMLGIKCDANFKNPYFSRSVKEFWNRWHISLSSWLRDYVYFSLGGSRCSQARKFFNLMVTFFVSGMWHGAGFTFILWGLFHGLFVHLSPKSLAKTCNKFLITGSTLATFFIVAILWIFFRSENVSVATTFISRMFADLQINVSAVTDSVLLFTKDNTCLSKLLVVSGFIFVLAVKEWNDVYGKTKASRMLSSVWLVFMICSILLFGKFGSGFIYGNF